MKPIKPIRPEFVVLKAREFWRVKHNLEQLRNNAQAALVALDAMLAQRDLFYPQAQEVLNGTSHQQKQDVPAAVHAETPHVSPSVELPLVEQRTQDSRGKSDDASAAGRKSPRGSAAQRQVLTDEIPSTKS